MYNPNNIDTHGLNLEMPLTALIGGYRTTLDTRASLEKACRQFDECCSHWLGKGLLVRLRIEYVKLIAVYSTTAANARCIIGKYRAAPNICGINIDGKWFSSRGRLQGGSFKKLSVKKATEILDGLEPPRHIHIVFGIRNIISLQPLDVSVDFAKFYTVKEVIETVAGHKSSSGLYRYVLDKINRLADR